MNEVQVVEVKRVLHGFVRTSDGRIFSIGISRAEVEQTIGIDFSYKELHEGDVARFTCSMDGESIRIINYEREVFLGNIEWLAFAIMMNPGLDGLFSIINHKVQM